MPQLVNSQLLWWAPGCFTPDLTKNAALRIKAVWRAVRDAKVAEKAEAEEAAKAASLEAPPTYTSSQVAGQGGGEAEGKKV